MTRMALLREVRIERPRPAPGTSALPRALGVDALRGLAILGMVLVAASPLGVLPAWMYHAQTPPPTHAMDVAVAGLTWPDLVFPVFIFTLGVAIPLASARRLDDGARGATIAFGALSRALLLVFFALFRQHFDSTVSGLAPPAAWLTALAGFAALFLIFVRLPRHWSRASRAGVRGAGWAAALGLFAAVPFPDGTTFTPARIDIILLVLAYCALLGTLVWLATRRNLPARLGVLACVAAIWSAADHPGWVATLYAFDPAPSFYSFAFVHFLCAVIPGTIVGDLIVEHGSESREPGSGIRESRRAVLLIPLMPAVLAVTLAGVQARQLLATTAIATAIAGVALLVMRRPATAQEALLARLLRWGTSWLLLGLLLDPVQGGTKKVPETLAWFFQGSGLAIFTLVACIVIADVLRRPRWLRLLIDTGQNPMLAYVVLGMLILPLLGLSGVSRAVDALLTSPWLAFGWSVLLTLGAALLVQQATRRRWLWRS